MKHDAPGPHFVGPDFCVLPPETAMHLRSPVEVLYLQCMLKWEQTAPAAGEQGLLDGVTVENSQQIRLASLLEWIAAGAEERTYRSLANQPGARRRNGGSHLALDPDTLTKALALSGGWFIDGCLSLVQKHNLLQGLRDLGLSHAFVECAEAFVADHSVERFMPPDEALMEMIARAEEKNGTIEKQRARLQAQVENGLTSVRGLAALIRGEHRRALIRRVLRNRRSAVPPDALGAGRSSGRRRHTSAAR